jgi:hypothetical protein
LLEQVMLENNEASVDHSGITEDLLPVGKHLANGCSATIDVEVWFTGHQSEDRVISACNIPSVSKVAKGLMRVYMTGVKPMAAQIARTRSLFG